MLPLARHDRSCSESCTVPPLARSVKLYYRYGLIMSKTAGLDTFTIQTLILLIFIVMHGCMLSRGRGGRVPSPRNETLYMLYSVVHLNRISKSMRNNLYNVYFCMLNLATCNFSN